MAIHPQDIGRGGSTRLHPSSSPQPNARTRSKTVLINEAVAVPMDTMTIAAPTSTAATADVIISKPSLLDRVKEACSSMDSIACVAYVCSIITLSLPVLLVPMAASDQLGVHAQSLVTSKVASISSAASAGGAIGNLVNGFICKEMGTYSCSKWYLAGLALCSVLFSLSTTPLALGAAYAGIEFFASVQCAALSVMLTDYYENNAAKLAAALTALGISSTVAEIFAKVMGTTLTSTFQWRQVAQIGAVISLIGAFAVSKAPGRHLAKQLQQSKEQFQWSSVMDSLKVVLGSGLFWKIALAYSMAFVAVCSDRILGSFYHAATALPHSICGGLTLSVTLGLVYGLVSASNKLPKMETLQDKTAFFSRRYTRSVAATVGLTALAYFGTPLNKLFMASAISILSFFMASDVAFQCYQFPAMIAKKFGDHQAVCITFLDGFGYLLSVPLYAILGQLVPKFGWSSGWGLLSVLFAAGGITMMRSIPPILKLHSDDHDKDM